MYQEIIQPHIRPLLGQQVSAISDQSKQNSALSDITKRDRLHREPSTASMISERSSSVVTCESSTCELPQRNAHRRVTFSLNPDLTIKEHTNENESDNVFDSCFVVTSPGSVNEAETNL